MYFFNQGFLLNCFGAVLQFGHLARWQVQDSGVLRCSGIYLYLPVYPSKRSPHQAHSGGCEARTGAVLNGPV